MPNKKSAERRMRSDARKRAQNKAVKSKVKSMEKGYLAQLQTGNKDAAIVALNRYVSAVDKAAKTGVIHHGTANRKKSRLSLRLNALN